MIAQPLITVAPGAAGRRPRDEDLDLFGLTHPGRVRPENQDHFLVCTVHQQIAVHGTSLPEPDQLPLRGERLATILMVADGVGGGQGGGEASRLAVEAITRYVSSTMRCFHTAGNAPESEFHDALTAAALDADASIRAQAVTHGGQKMATTLTLAMIVFPRMYVLQVGDSRCYLLMDDALHRLTRDQTMAQAMVDLGALKPEDAERSPLKNVLASAIGGREAAPVVTVLDIKRDAVVLLCSDGLTKHVEDHEIDAHIRSMQSSEQLCRDLVDLAIERGGSDNITVLVGRAPERRPKRADASSNQT